MDLLTKIVDLLKASGWQAAMIAVAAGLFLFLSDHGVLPKLSEVLTLGALAVMFLSAALAIAPVAAALQDWVAERIAKAQVIRDRRTAVDAVKQKFRDYLPYMTSRERQILGYLLKRRQKLFTADADGGYAGTLMSLGFVTIVARPGQQFDSDKVPLGVPDPVWEVLEEDTSKFDYTPEMHEDDPTLEPEPWRIPWQ